MSSKYDINIGNYAVFFYRIAAQDTVVSEHGQCPHVSQNLVSRRYIRGSGKLMARAR